jgi:hypothetical protein
MPRSKRLPPHALHLPTYAELEKYVAAFAQGHLNLLLIVGPPGVGKSRAVRQALTGPVGWIGGQASPLGIYMQTYLHRNQPLVLDDVDGLYADRDGVRLLKALAQTEPRKTLSWHTRTPILDRDDIPRQFTTTSRVALIGNDWRTLNADVAALEDRGHLLVFEPSPLEVHRQAAGWFWDQEIFDLVATHLQLFERHSLRTYLQAWELKQAGLDWRQAVLSRYLTGVALVVAKLRANPAFASETERVRAFVASGAGCRATYFNHVRKLQAPPEPPRVLLTHTQPPAALAPSEGHLDQLRQRFGDLHNG